MQRFRLTILLACCLLAAAAVTSCAEPPAEESPAADTTTGGPDVAVATMPEPTEAMATEPVAEDRPTDESGCRPSAAEVLESLEAETAAAGATIGQTASMLLDVDEMIYGTWEVNAADVTLRDGTQETAVWVTKVVPPGQWSSSAASGSLAYSVNDVAADLSSYEPATSAVFGREIDMEDASVVAAIACLQ
jgi:hypothetical protein